MITSFKSKRLVAVVLMFTFAWLLNVTAAPLKAADKPATAASENDNPGAIEQSGQRYTGGHSSALPIIIGVVAVAAIAAVLILVVFKTKYDITGTWDVAYQWEYMTSAQHYSITFTGNTSSGTFTYSEPGQPDASGTYAQNKKNVSWTFLVNGSAVYTGTFTDKNNMSGNIDTNAGTWTATRTSSPTTSQPKTRTDGNSLAGSGYRR